VFAGSVTGQVTLTNASASTNVREQHVAEIALEVRGCRRPPTVTVRFRPARETIWIVSQDPDCKHPFAALMATYEGPILAFVVRQYASASDREDLFQDIFLAVCGPRTAGVQRRLEPTHMALTGSPHNVRVDVAGACPPQAVSRSRSG
jgi:hypothetical protein